MRYLFIFFTCAQCLLLLRSNANVFSRRGSISFENADITVSIKTPNGEKIAEAFNATTAVKDPRKMRWVSVGLPRLLIRKEGLSASKNSIFKFVMGGFYIFIETLSTDVVRELAIEASQKYGVNIAHSQFFAIDKHIENFNCFVEMFDNDTKEFVKIIGNAALIANPIAVFFKLPNSVPKYAAILRNEANPLIFQCTIEARGRNSKQNLGKINSSKNETVEDKSSAEFTEKFSLTTEDFRVTDIVSECAEAVEQRAIGRLNAVLTATSVLNQTLREIKQAEQSTSTRIDCALAMSTRNDYMKTMLRGANLSACSDFSIPGGHGFAMFTSNGSFTVPPGVFSVRALAVGGGAGGASVCGGGGGSGYVRVGELAVTPLIQIKVTVGRGGRGSSMKMNDDTQTGGGGGRSSFGSLLSADGGSVPRTWHIGGHGGSGGGAPWFNGVSGTSGAGGTDGANGANSGSGQSGGTGQGAFSQLLRIFRLNVFTAGSGGAGASGTNMGGGGGGGVLMNGEGPSGGRGQLGTTFGGIGYGAGGAGGTYVIDNSKGNPRYAGGDGTDGLVYVEW